MAIQRYSFEVVEALLELFGIECALCQTYEKPVSSMLAWEALSSEKSSVLV